ncbi:hypothetical protein SDC9_194991 [bioreactor metagenome]|uniref:Uncharacterized protein n=1 Tax=bioreactor metagenome TaxID=1076179 RepID=A0A645IAB9_9ZZZZ
MGNAGQRDLERSGVGLCRKRQAEDGSADQRGSESCVHWGLCD